MKRSRLLALVAVLVTIVTNAPLAARAETDWLKEGSPFCDQTSAGKGTHVVADGPSAQVSVHAEVFEPAYARACRSGAGMVSYIGSGDRVGVRAIVVHDESIPLPTSDVALSTDELLTAETDMEIQGGRRSLLNQIPLYIDAQVVAYNLPRSCNATTLNLRSPVLSLIFAGRITKWNDAALTTADNPDMKSCDLPIRLVKRVDFSASTQIFKDYLAKRTGVWDYYKLPDHNQEWPTVTSACNALGARGVADCVQSLAGSIGYLPLHNARLSGLRTARLDNSQSFTQTEKLKQFIAPSAASCAAVGDHSVVLPGLAHQTVTSNIEATNGLPPTRMDWSAVSLTDSPYGYPLCSISFAFAFEHLSDAYLDYPLAQARTVVDYLWVALGESAQKKLARYDLVALPKPLLDAARQGVSSIRYQAI